MAITHSNIITVQHSGIYNDAEGDDVYILSNSGLSSIDSNATIFIEDHLGDNKLLLQQGLYITQATVSLNSLQLNLNTGTSITLVNAENFSFINGGSPHQPGIELNYTDMLSTLFDLSIMDNSITETINNAVIIGISDIIAL